MALNGSVKYCILLDSAAVEHSETHEKHPQQSFRVCTAACCCVARKLASLEAALRSTLKRVVLCAYFGLDQLVQSGSYQKSVLLHYSSSI